MSSAPPHRADNSAARAVLLGMRAQVDAQGAQLAALAANIDAVLRLLAPPAEAAQPEGKTLPKTLGGQSNKENA